MNNFKEFKKEIKQISKDTLIKDGFLESHFMHLFYKDRCYEHEFINVLKKYGYEIGKVGFDYLAPSDILQPKNVKFRYKIEFHIPI